jgi:hypothetical protein
LRLPEKLGAVSDAPDEAYPPFLVATQTGQIDISKLDLHTPQAAAQEVLNGRIPDNHGAISFGPDGLGAVDLLAVRTSGNKAFFLSTYKSAVNKETYDIEAEGGAVLTLPDGRMRLSAVAIGGAKANWFRGRSLKRVASDIGSITIAPLGLDAIDYEVSDINPSGFIVARKRPFIVSF